MNPYTGILIGPYEFEGPYASLDELQNKPGLFAIIATSNDEDELLAIGDSDRLKDCLKDQVSSLSKTSSGALSTAVLYTRDLPAEQRQNIKLAVLREFDEELAA
jgi:hypothetical protein